MQKIWKRFDVERSPVCTGTLSSCKCLLCHEQLYSTLLLYKKARKVIPLIADFFNLPKEASLIWQRVILMSVYFCVSSNIQGIHLSNGNTTTTKTAENNICFSLLFLPQHLKLTRFDGHNYDFRLLLASEWLTSNTARKLYPGCRLTFEWLNK